MKKSDDKLLANFKLFSERTNYPKLGYLIHMLNKVGVASIIHGESAHAPMLYVASGKASVAWEILSWGVDDLPDDAPRFAEFANEKPDPDLYSF